ncbi:hypothetical protein [Streptomyces mirabilis]
MTYVKYAKYVASECGATASFPVDVDGRAAPREGSDDGAHPKMLGPVP